MGIINDKNAVLYIEEPLFENRESKKNVFRAYELNNGDIFTVADVTLQFDEKILYEVFEDGEDVIQEVVDGVNYRVIQTKWTRTGKVYTIDQLNEIIDKKEDEV